MRIRRELNRVPPVGPPQAYQTYTYAQPLKTHWARVPCGEAVGGCEAHRRGWSSVIDVSTELGRQRARYIAHDSGRAFTVDYRREANMIEFTFPAGQQCFEGHYRLKGDAPLVRLRTGDHRSRVNTGTITVFNRVGDWRDHMAEHQQRLADRRQRG